ncbi:ATP-binding protein [Streptomyces sp. NPDC050658]|uniref:ATP-binding protein n=1 Tax=unclassified Streptomyces TaxID=2593676 RepID=UPI003413CA97
MDSLLPPASGDAWEYCLTLPHTAIGPGVARSTVRAILTRHALAGLADTAELLTSELCGNAYRYSAGPVAVRVRWRDGTLHVGVRDGSGALPCPTGEGMAHDREGGRGLLLVSRCAQAWGSRAAPPGPGKVTWFELRA